MPLEELLKTIGALKKRAESHRPILGASEAQTRYSLIDPFLRALGWNTEDPEQVRPEYETGAGEADYILLLDGKAEVVVEAKRVGTSLIPFQQKGVSYCVTKGIPYFVLTNGTRWELYDTFKRVGVAEKQIAAFDLVTEPSAEVARKALALWRPISVREPAPPSVFSPALSAVPTVTAPPPGAPAPAGVALSDAKPKLHAPPPKTIVFPDGSTAEVQYWNHVLLKTVEWLRQKGHLAPTHLPISSSRERYIVASTAKHPSGKDFWSPKQVGPFFVETNADVIVICSLAKKVVKLTGQDPAMFRLVF